MCWYSLPLTALAVTISLTWTAINFLFIRRSIKLNRELTKAHNKISGIVQQIFEGLAKFRVQGNEEQAYHLWGKHFEVEIKNSLAGKLHVNFGNDSVNGLYTSDLFRGYVLRERIGRGRKNYQGGN